jgi:hypothetical protein
LPASGAELVNPRRGTDTAIEAIAEAIRSLPADRALINGEAIVLRHDGRSDFGALMTERGGGQASLVALDLLRREDQDLRPRPIEARRARLPGGRVRRRGARLWLAHLLDQPRGVRRGPVR